MGARKTINKRILRKIGSMKREALVVFLVILAILFLGRMELKVAGQFKVIEEVQERQTITVDIALPEREIADVKVGQKVVLEVLFFPEVGFPGQVTSIAPIATADGRGGRTRIVTSEIDNSLGWLEEEMTGTTQVYFGKRRIFDLMTRRWWPFSDSGTASVPATANTPLSDATEISRSPVPESEVEPATAGLGRTSVADPGEGDVAGSPTAATREDPAARQALQSKELIDEPAPGAIGRSASTDVERSPAPTERPPTNQLGSTSTRGVGFAVQIAASRTRQEAEELRTQWEGRGYTAYVVEADIPGLGRYYRVRVGPFDTQEEAREVTSNMQSRFPQEIPDFWIVSYQQ